MNISQERTLFIIKPDAIAKNFDNLIISDIKKAGFKIIAQKRIIVSKEAAERLYAEHEGRDYYPGLLKLIQSGPSIVMLIEGRGVIAKLREFMGDTFPWKAEVGTLRAKYGEKEKNKEFNVVANAVHGSDSIESARKEIPIFFNEKELP